MCSINTRLFLKTLPLAFMYNEWYLEIFKVRHSICMAAFEQQLEGATIVNMAQQCETYRCLSIFFCSRYLRKRRRNTRILLIQSTAVGIRASAVPLRFPVPMCLPKLLAAAFSRTRNRECIATGLRMMSPSLANFRIFCPVGVVDVCVCVCVCVVGVRGCDDEGGGKSMEMRMMI